MGSSKFQYKSPAIVRTEAFISLLCSCQELIKIVSKLPDNLLIQAVSSLFYRQVTHGSDAPHRWEQALALVRPDY